MPKLTIVTVTYNRAHTLKNNFDSVIKQTFKNIEHIIVDNMSSDETALLVKSYIKKAPYKVIYIREPDTGIYNAMNKGIKLAKGIWIHLLNSDDKYSSINSLSYIFNNIKISNYDLIVSSICVKTKKNKYVWKPEYIEKFNFFNFPHQGTILKRSFYKTHGYFDENYKYVSDAIYNILNYPHTKYLILTKLFVIMGGGGATSKMSFGYFIERTKVIVYFHQFPLIYKCRLIGTMVTQLIKFSFLDNIEKINKFSFSAKTKEHTLNSINYYNNRLYYSNKYSLVDRYIKNGSYEPLMCEKLLKNLKKYKNPTFLDIGANIGMISLYINAHIENIRIYAFEPGKHQKMLFNKTLKKNNLKSIKIIPYALSNKNGYSNFASHKDMHTSGDGFFDTHRAGKSFSYKVRTITLDSWWHKNNKPIISVIKIDTEGSEGWVLEGGKNLIMQCKPTIFFELWPENLKVYPYNHELILNLLRIYRYNLFTLKDIQINRNIDRYLGTEETFVARPISQL